MRYADPTSGDLDKMANMRTVFDLSDLALSTFVPPA